MKCDGCKYKNFHSGGSWYSVAEGGDDPYNYEYCSKGHWCGSPEDYQDLNKNIDDPFDNCPDYDYILNKHEK